MGVEDRRAGTGHSDVVTHEMFAAGHGHRGELRHHGADAIGALPYYVTHANSKNFQPMNVNFGIIKELGGERIRDKKERYTAIAERALEDLSDYLNV